MRTQLTTLLLLPLFASCASLVDTEQAPSISGDASYASAYWFRGTPINTEGVFQGSLAASVPIKQGGSLTATTWLNIDADDDAGDSFSAGGDERDVTEADFVLDYTRPYEGFDASVGIISYQFPNTALGATHEAYVGLSKSLFGLDHSLTLYWDFDEVGDIYANYGISKGFELDEKLTLGLSASLGYMGEDQAGAYYGVLESGLADLMGSAQLDYEIDECTSAFLSVNAVTSISSDLEDALKTANVDENGFWIALGFGWAF